MPQVTVQMRTLTPLWTGGAAGTMNRVRETGIIGSLRWWYEAIVRGLGGWACDPTAEQEGARCQFDGDAYGEALRAGGEPTEALAAGLKSVCPVCFLFGCGGWRRSFQLDIPDLPLVPLHFRTLGRAPQMEWLGRVFNGQKIVPATPGQLKVRIDHLKVAYGAKQQPIKLVLRGDDAAYVRSQLVGLLAFVSAYGALGSRAQHGFGQVELNSLPDQLQPQAACNSAILSLRARLVSEKVRCEGPVIDGTDIFDLRQFFSLTFVLTPDKLAGFRPRGAHFGDPGMQAETRYFPCAFDLRYKGGRPTDDGQVMGLRQWLRDVKEWKETSDPARLEELDEWLGPRSQWGTGDAEQHIADEQRIAARVFFGMPYQDGRGYRLRIFGFAPPKHPRVPTATQAVEVVEAYMHQLYGIAPEHRVLGAELIAMVETPSAMSERTEAGT